jgi:hypothetical protein
MYNVVWAHWLWCFVSCSWNECMEWNQLSLNHHDDSSVTIEWVCALLCDLKKICTRQSARLGALVLGLQSPDLILALRKEVGKALGQGPSRRKALKLITKEALRNRERYLPKVEIRTKKQNALQQNGRHWRWLDVRFRFRRCPPTTLAKFQECFTSAAESELTPMRHCVIPKCWTNDQRRRRKTWNQLNPSRRGHELSSGLVYVCRIVDSARLWWLSKAEFFG